MNTCRVRGCRFNDSHIASAHRCGVCGQFGHGEIECGNQGSIDRLKHLSRNDKLNENDYCDLKYCDYRWSHKRSAHHCIKCGERAHCVTDCPSAQQRSGGLFSRWEMDSNMMENDSDSEKDDMYDDVSDSKNESKNSSGSKHVVKCPTCRKYNVFNDITKVFVDSECAVCMDNKAQVLLPTCSHVCVCIECCSKLNEYKGTNLPDGSGSHSNSSSSNFFPADDEGSEDRACSIMGSEEGKIYVSIPAGMGCSFWYRRNSRDGPLERLFMNSDDWGQYGHGRVSQHTSFISGYRMIS